MSVAGTFYPDSENEIKRYIKHFDDICDVENSVIPSSKAVIVPHAGYVYSGYTANFSYKALKKSGKKKFVVIGPSHRVALDGVSLCNFEAYKTPFGDIKTNLEMVRSLEEKFDLKCVQQAHMEHSTEVQFPFLKHYIEGVEIVELVYGRVDPKFISEIIDFVYADEEWGVVISTDLSHFYNINEANTLDTICVEAVEQLDTLKLRDGCEACGILGVEAMINSAKKLGLTSHILDYRTSADASGDNSSVVGYLSACFV
jgi:AmmeMemoRadiSam system protein B